MVLAEADALENHLADRAKNDAYNQIMVGVGVAFLGIVCLWIFAGSLTRPIVMAKEFAESVAAGDFSRQLMVSQQDEIGVLADSAAHNGYQFTSHDCRGTRQGRRKPKGHG